MLSNIFCLTRPPPIAPRFPYTTLFRSAGEVAEHVGDAAHRGEVVQDKVELLVRRVGGGVVEGDRARRAVRKVRAQGRRDRKSTRLNSSHSQISYAVFCLKKKTPSSHTT